jgi:hypothetical protein
MTTAAESFWIRGLKYGAAFVVIQFTGVLVQYEINAIEPAVQGLSTIQKTLLSFVQYALPVMLTAAVATWPKQSPVGYFAAGSNWTKVFWIGITSLVSLLSWEGEVDFPLTPRETLTRTSAAAGGFCLLILMQIGCDMHGRTYSALEWSEAIVITGCSLLPVMLKRDFFGSVNLESASIVTLYLSLGMLQPMADMLRLQWFSFLFKRYGVTFVDMLFFTSAWSILLHALSIAVQGAVAGVLRAPPNHDLLILTPVVHLATELYVVSKFGPTEYLLALIFRAKLAGLQFYSFSSLPKMSPFFVCVGLTIVVLIARACRCVLANARAQSASTNARVQSASTNAGPGAQKAKKRD